MLFFYEKIEKDKSFVELLLREYLQLDDCWKYDFAKKRFEGIVCYKDYVSTGAMYLKLLKDLEPTLSNDCISSAHVTVDKQPRREEIMRINEDEEKASRSFPGRKLTANLIRGYDAAAREIGVITMIIDVAKVSLYNIKKLKVDPVKLKR